ncbi:hypothetical protein CFOL_v3_31364 [Cephalotus follicularis]|uniref:Uncharacterized protein n=1 Tax=Cephalotus follicularis TaxID=3775 RepID=A0A1Q3D637_CEPFO|nr:hypothetical protein CFOL_v3_31364 [Cephalotus follicularis]
MSEGVKLYTNKPKKAQLKSSSSSSAAASYVMGSQSTPPPPPPPQPPKESFAKRYKFLWPLVLTVNLVIGAYVFIRTNQKDTSKAKEENAKDVASTLGSTTAGEAVLVTPSSFVTKPVKLQEPISEDQQRELFKWILEEKRKVKPKDSEEKKRIDEEKAILKQFIRAKSIPSI